MKYLTTLILITMFCACGSEGGQNAWAEAKAELARESARLDSLEAAKADSVKQKLAADFAALLPSLRKTEDEFSGNVFYYAKTTPQQSTKSAIYPYIATCKDCTPTLRLLIRYGADDWLFVSNYSIKADSTTFQYRPRVSVERDNGYDGIWEWSDDVVRAETEAILNAVAGSKKATVRYHGSTYYDDRDVTAKEKQAIKDVLAAYYALGGQAKE